MTRPLSIDEVPARRPGFISLRRARVAADGILGGMALNLRALPGGDLVEEGLSDLARGIGSIPALLVSIGAPRLRRIGLPVPEPVIPMAEHRLYEILSTSGPDSAHSRYNALLRRLVSFERAAECGGL